MSGMPNRSQPKGSRNLNSTWMPSNQSKSPKIKIYRPFYKKSMIWKMSPYCKNQPVINSFDNEWHKTAFETYFIIFHFLAGKMATRTRLGKTTEFVCFCFFFSFFSFFLFFFFSFFLSDWFGMNWSMKCGGTSWNRAKIGPKFTCLKKKWIDWEMKKWKNEKIHWKWWLKINS